MRSYVTSWATGGAVPVAVVREPKLTGGGAGRYSMVVIYSLLPTVVAAAGGRAGGGAGRYSMVVIYSLLPTVVAAAGGRGGPTPGRRPWRRSRRSGLAPRRC